MLTELSRDDFVNEYFEYRPGQHVICVAPTGGGKSYLIWQLLSEAMRQQPHLSVQYQMPKPADPTTVSFAARMGLRETPVWPPRKKLFEPKPNGYVLWPPHPQNLTPDERHDAVGAELRKGLDAQFWRGNSISVVDDAHSAATMMGLNPNIEETLVNGRANGSGLWLGTQKPSGTLVSGGITSFAWSSAHHLFIGKTPNDADIKRYSEIGGLDPKVIDRTVRNLRTYSVNGNTLTEWLYISKSGPYAALIGT
jgi:hypothetical protein